MSTWRASSFLDSPRLAGIFSVASAASSASTCSGVRRKARSVVLVAMSQHYATPGRRSMPASREYPLDNSVNERQDGAMSTMSVENARKALEQAMNSAIIWRNGDGVAEKVDALIASVRAE